MSDRPVRFYYRGRIVSLNDVPPTRTLLEWLREDAGATGTKEGCGEGDCGACTVVLGELDRERLRYRAINSCIRFVSSIDGCALWTVEDLRGADGSLHPVQQALVDSHATQCGFCTPGFAMSMFALYQQRRACGRTDPVDTGEAHEALSGNLCRCTGYRPIVDATRRMTDYPAPAFDEAAVVRQLQALQQAPALDSGRALRPQTLAQLLQLRAAHPQAQVIAGCTDVGLWVTKMHRRFDTTLDVTGVRELQQVEVRADALEIGAAVRLSDAFAVLAAHWPQLQDFFARFAGRPVRESGTLGGNVVNGSPIGDSMPLLIALGAQLRLQGTRGVRELALEDFYTGYRQNLLAADEVLTHVRVPLPPRGLLRAYKLSKRFEDDISAVCLAIRLEIDAGTVRGARIGAGGLAATPKRAVQTEAALVGRPWTEATVQQAMQVLQQEFAPISDMRASAEYRREAAGNLLWRYWLESQGAAAPLRLERLTLASLDGALS
ncbi:xanthine dehydrogenase small subunit [Caldimonas thermodepolymerans]|jgi:xanthine dehydrogenase, small subunit|uniref:Xanthine dehydrogenase small subunit n=1 Tax=Caldimonas thermodepolymerans TaxID=215580 RepID=A0AA46HX23_9BURK|nr:xanthine dehydrogenase small subunit [Caldimonas thermodepolymerans]TCP08798.1 xanthine dehydrogenase small subunit [Caldimonas thermodepolymerans]UZG47119.1 xanthine dehydrogenase small subunit [Caldimonas thermodepolymerans]